MRLILNMALWLLALTGCMSDKYDTTIRKHGGYNALRAECLNLSTDVFSSVTSHRYSVRSNFPPLIALLKPEMICLYSSNPPVVYINIGGGLRGHGLLVVCTTNTVAQSIHVESYEKITQLDTAVYEYLYLD